MGSHYLEIMYIIQIQRFLVQQKHDDLFYLGLRWFMFPPSVVVAFRYLRLAYDAPQLRL